MKLGFLTAPFPDTDLMDVADWAVSADFEILEIACWPRSSGPTRRYAGTSHIDVANLSAGQATEIRDQIHAKGLEISGLGYYPNPLHPDPEQRSAAIEHLKRVIAAAEMLRVPIVGTFVGRDRYKTVEDNFGQFEQVWPPIVKFANDHDQRNEAQFQLGYNHKPTGIYAIFNGRYDSGVPTDVEPGTTLAQFVAEGFDPRLYNEIDFQRGRVKPRTVLDFSIGADLRKNERVSLNLQFDVQNLTNELFLYNFESVFSGTHVGYPRMYSGRLALRFK